MASALLDVIAEQGKHSGREQEDGHKIEYGHETHSQIDDTPCRLQCDQRPGHHYHTCNDAEQLNRSTFLRHETDIGFSIEIIGNDRTVGKKEYRRCDE